MAYFQTAEDIYKSYRFNLKAVKEITPIKDPTLKESVDTIQSKTQKNNNISVKESVEDSNNSVSAAEKSKMLRNALFD